MAIVSHKKKKTYSLSPTSVQYIQRIRVSAKLRSDSEALDGLIREKMLEAERNRISASISNYYDTLSDEQQEEARNWGQTAESHFVEDADE